MVRRTGLKGTGLGSGGFWGSAWFRNMSTASDDDDGMSATGRGGTAGEWGQWRGRVVGQLDDVTTRYRSVVLAHQNARVTCCGGCTADRE